MSTVPAALNAPGAGNWATLSMNVPVGTGKVHFQCVGAAERRGSGFGDRPRLRQAEGARRRLTGTEVTRGVGGDRRRPGAELR